MRIVYLFVLILFTINNIYGQSAIKISSEKVNINGVTYYAHTVQKQETLYSLSKAYNTTIDAIVKQNASAASGLKAGSIIYIPVSTAASGSAATSESTTASAISANASAAETAPVQKATQVADKKQAKEKKQKGTEYKYEKHTVKWYEDITDISEKYGVSVEDILKANNLKSSKLKTRQTLIIPIPNHDSAKQLHQQSDKQQPQNQQLDQQLDQLEQQLGEQHSQQLDQQQLGEQHGQQLGEQQDAYQDSQQTFRYRNKGEAVEIGYILPLNSVDTNSVSSNFMDFYAGSLLAVNDIKSKDFPITINLYDESEYSPLHRLMDAPGFDKNQLLVGPVRANSIKGFTGYAMQKEIPIVSPLDNGAESCTEGNPYFIQIPANTLSQIENTIDLLDKCRVKDSVSTVLLISENNCGSDSVYVNNTKRLLEEKGINYTPISYGILDGREIFTTIIASVDTLSPYQHIAIVPSNSEAFVSDVVRNLDLCGKSGAKVTLFGFPKWRNFETINVELLHKMRLHISLPYYVDYNNSDVKQFLLQYRALYNTEPTPYAFQGYDITKYILTLMEKYGNSFIKVTTQESPKIEQNLETKTLHQTQRQIVQQSQEQMLQQSQSQILPQSQEHMLLPDQRHILLQTQEARLLQSNFQLHRTEPGNGLKNRATRNIRYNPDYTIEVVD